MNCPHCKKKIPDADLAKHLGSKGGSKQKNYTAAEKRLRRKRMAVARKSRHNDDSDRAKA